MVERKRKNESFEAFIRRTKKHWQQSGKMLQVKKIRFYERKKNRNARRSSTLHRLRVKSKIDYLKKIGRLPEESRKTNKK